MVQLLVRFGPSRRLMAGRLTGIGIAYPVSGPRPHPWVGRRMPDLPCVGGRLYDLMHDGNGPDLVHAAVSEVVRWCGSDAVTLGR